jgi:hypothetical protein
MPTGPDPLPREFWSTSKGRTVEILARDTVVGRDPRAPWDVDLDEIDTVAYKFLGGTMIHLRAVSTLINWTKVDFE